MRNVPLKIFQAILWLPCCLCSDAGAQDQPEPKSLEPVVVSATRVGQRGFDLPLSIDGILGEEIRQANPAINLSEPLVRVPGVVAQNRQNYAQDLQISSRGFGARSAFGVRGVRLYADGIPATMPDGQGQTSHFDLESAERIEVLRGPFSALYGNSSGGVISVYTENGPPGFHLEPFFQAGSYGLRHYGLKAGGQQGAADYVVAASRFDIGGYRQHSAATRDTGNAKLRITSGEDSTLTLVGNSVSMRDVQDPLGLTHAQFNADPRAATPEAFSFNTRKSVEQQQLGLNYEKSLGGADKLNLTLYGGRRSTLQFLAVPVAAQRAPGSAGGVVDLARDYGGIDARWTRKQALASGTLQWTAGFAVDTLQEERKGYENFAGDQLGVIGRLRRNETNRATNIDQYLQAQWEPDARWLLLAGVRNSNVRMRSRDHFLASGNGDDSGEANFHAVTPVLGATCRVSPKVNLYASYGRGFETPTLNELAYRLAADGTATSGFNSALQPTRSNNFELGLKARLGPYVRTNLALFHIDTRNELTVLANTGGRAVYQNSGKTRRNGIELAMEGQWPGGAGFVLAYSQMRAVYGDAFCSGPCSPATQVKSGNRLPGVPDQTLYGELSWRHAASGFSAALEGKAVGRVFVDDVNSDAAPGYFIANLRAGLEQSSGHWKLRQFARIDNLAGRSYAGSVIVNESNRRFFEPAPRRNFVAGITAEYSW